MLAHINLWLLLLLTLKSKFKIYHNKNISVSI